MSFQVFNNISIAIPDTGGLGTCSVEDMLDCYFRQERVAGWVCDSCTAINALKVIDAGMDKCNEGLAPILEELRKQGVIGGGGRCAVLQF